MRSEAEIREAWAMFALGAECTKGKPELKETYVTMALMRDALSYCLNEPSSLDTALPKIKADIEALNQKTADSLKKVRKAHEN